MKYLLLTLFLLVSCNSKEQQKEKKQQLRKRIPVQNRSFINQVNNSNVNETLNRIRALEREELLQLSNGASSKLNYSDKLETKKSTSSNAAVVKTDHQKEIIKPSVQSKTPAIEEDLIFKDNSNNKSATNKEVQLTQEIDTLRKVPDTSENQILEISGEQNKNKNNTKFLLSTSASYSREGAEEVRRVLNQYGNVRIQSQNGNFILKLYPNQPINTQEDAKNFLRTVIKHPFFDIYIEKVE